MVLNPWVQTFYSQLLRAIEIGGYVVLDSSVNPHYFLSPSLGGMQGGCRRSKLLGMGFVSIYNPK